MHGMLHTTRKYCYHILQNKQNDINMICKYIYMVDILTKRFMLQSKLNSLYNDHSIILYND